MFQTIGRFFTKIGRFFYREPSVSDSVRIAEINARASVKKSKIKAVSSFFKGGLSKIIQGGVAIKGIEAASERANKGLGDNLEKKESGPTEKDGLLNNNNKPEGKDDSGITNQFDLDLDAYNPSGSSYINGRPNEHHGSTTNEIISTSPFDFTKKMLLTDEQLMLYFSFFFIILIFAVFITYKINSKFKQFELDWYNLTCFCLIIFSFLFFVLDNLGLYEFFLNDLIHIEEIPEYCEK